MDELSARRLQIAYLDGLGLRPSRYVLSVHQQGVAKPRGGPLIEAAAALPKDGGEPPGWSR